MKDSQKDDLRKCDLTLQGGALFYLCLIHTYYLVVIPQPVNVTEATHSVSTGHGNGDKVGLLSAQQVLSRAVSKVT